MASADITLFLSLSEANTLLDYLIDAPDIDERDVALNEIQESLEDLLN